MSGPCARPECGGEVHTDPWGTPVRCPLEAAGPLRLTVDELVPVLAALERRSRQQQAGHSVLLYPLPRCPSCGAPPDEMTTAPSPDFVTDTVTIQFERCGHSFTAEGGVIEEAGEQARQMVDQMEQRPAGEPDAANVPSPDHTDGHPEPPSEAELNPALPVRPDPRQAAYDAVYEYIRNLGQYLPPDPVHRNAIIWKAVHAALGATHLGRCLSSHCVEGDHTVFVEGGWEAP